ncbi:MAG: sugar ABC transporter ATP-binding protein [Chloroflexota bacterium]|nr:sugar ABC transporter ATP-binding protein [Chloroflexota bacterium]
MRGISKRYGEIQALDDVSMDLIPGEIHALLGENGAGKSTLIKVMTGVVQPDIGDIFINQQKVHIGSAFDAQTHAVVAIYQEPMVFPDLTVAENIFIGHRDRGRIVNRRKMREEAEEVLARLDVRLDVMSPASGLTLAQQQTVEIAKALSLNVRVLIMDEPTASLSAHEAAQLFGIISKLRSQGVAILFISHRLEEVFEQADRITVMRDGAWISTTARAEMTVNDAIQQMVGREIVEFYARTESDPGEVILTVEDLGVEDAFEGVSFELREGEVLGFAGLVGARRTDVGLALFGIHPADKGRIVLDGKEVRIRNSHDALGLGIAYATEDRRGLGLIFNQSIAANITLPALKRYLNRLGLIRRTLENATAASFRERLSIRAPSVHTPASSLSGGNQQKVVLSKWLDTKPRILILDEPTRGIDVGAKVEVHHLIDELVKEGIAIILISSDLPELLPMSDRILIMREGRQMGVVDGSTATQEEVLTQAMGQAEAPEVPVGEPVA